MLFLSDQAAAIRCPYCHGNYFPHSKGYCNRGSIDAWSGSGTGQTQTSQRSVSVTQCKHSMTQTLPGHFMFFSTWNCKKKKLLPATTPVLLWGAALHMSGEQDRGRWGQGVEAYGGHKQSHGNCLLIQPGPSLQWGFETRRGDSKDSSQRAGSAERTGTQQN